MKKKIFKVALALALLTGVAQMQASSRTKQAQQQIIVGSLKILLSTTSVYQTYGTVNKLWSEKKNTWPEKIRQWANPRVPYVPAGLLFASGVQDCKEAWQILKNKKVTAVFSK